MKKVFKKFVLIFLSAIIAVFGCATLSACSQAEKPKGSEGNNEDIASADNVLGKWSEYEGVKIAFADEQTYNDGEINIKKVLPELNCRLGEKSYMIADFDIQAPYDNDGRDTVTANVRIQPASSVSATIQDTNSGSISEETKDGIREIKATYKIPETAETVRNMRLVIQIEAKERGLTSVGLVFESSGNIQGVKTSEIGKTAVFGYNEDLEIKGSAVKGVGDEAAESVLIPSIADGYLITNIGWSAFKDYSRLKSVAMPDSIEVIGSSAFKGCGELTEINIPGSVSVIEEDAFSGCDKLLSKENGISYVNNWAVSCEDTLTNVSLKSDVKGIAESVFFGFADITELTLPNGLEHICEFAFYNCEGLTEINIPDSVKSVQYCAFGKCGRVEKIAVGGNNAFLRSVDNCLLSKDGKTLVTGCKNSVIPDGVTEIGNGAFSGCSDLTAITIPDGVTVIGDFGFSYCVNLTKIIIPDSVTSLGDSAFNGCTRLKNVTLSKNITDIKSYSFYYCSALTEITIPDGVTEIGGCAFSMCALTEIVIPEGVTSIGYNAFSDTKLSSVTIPASVTSIEGVAFAGCRVLKDINFTGTRSQWENIEKGTEIGSQKVLWNKDTGDYTVHCTNGDLTKAKAG